MNTPSGNRLVTLKNGLRRDSECKLCRLHEVETIVCMLGVGVKEPDAMIIGESPQSITHYLLEELLDEVGIDLDDLYVTSAVRCNTPGDRAPSKGEWKKCASWTQYELGMIKPKIVLLLGSVALESVLGIKGIKKARGQPIERDGVFYLPTYQPSYALHDERMRPVILGDLQKLKAMISSGGMPKEQGLSYKLVSTRLDVEELLEELLEEPLFVYDIETTSLSPWHGKIVSIGFGTSKHQWIVPVNHKLFSLPHDLVDYLIAEIDKMPSPNGDTFRAMKSARLHNSGGTGRYKSNQNIKFDALWMKVHYDVEWYGDFDTMLADYALDENKLHGLDILASERYGALNWDVPLTLKQGLTGTLDEHARYLALDLLYTYRLTIDMYDELEEQPGIARVFYRILMATSRLFINVEFDGVHVDGEEFDEVEKYLRTEMATCDIALNKIKSGVNWGSTKQVAQLLFTELKLPIVEETKGGAPSTNESVMKRLAPMHPVPSLLLKRREASQQLSFFVDGWKPHLKRNRLHPSFKLHGTVTGRLSCENPNLQQVPRDPRIRSLIRGYWQGGHWWELVEADLSQIELRILAELSRDPEMMRCFLEGIDIHWLTCMREIFRGGGYPKEMIATAIALTRRNKVSYEEAYEIMLKAGPDACVDVGPKKNDVFPGWKEVRKRAKAINFGYAYGMWWKKFVDYARDNYDVVVTPEQAQASRISYFALYSKLPAWHNKQRDFAHRHGYVRSMFGRKRRLPRAMDRDDTMERQSQERQAINSPVQSFASDLNLTAAIELSAKHPRSYFRIAGTVHDSILMYVRKDKLKMVVPDVLKVMSHPKMLDEFDVELNVPIEADVKIGPWSLGVSPEKYFA